MSRVTIQSELGPLRLAASDAPPPTLANMTYDRDLTESEARELTAAPSVRAPQALEKLRYSHHALARMVAQGVSTAEISAISGKSPATISRLTQSDPAFRGLVAHYKSVVDEQFRDVHARFAAKLELLGMASLDELFARLEDNPKAMTTRELKELFEVAAEHGLAPAPPRGASPPVAISVNFISSKPEGATIELQAEAATK